MGEQRESPGRTMDRGGQRQRDSNNRFESHEVSFSHVRKEVAVGDGINFIRSAAREASRVKQSDEFPHSRLDLRGRIPHPTFRC